MKNCLQRDGEQERRQRCHNAVRKERRKKEHMSGLEKRENEAPEGPEWSQTSPKMTPWGPLGGPWAPVLLLEPPQSPLGEALGRPGAPNKFLGRGLGPCWGEKLIDFRAPGRPREAAGGSRRGSGRPCWEHGKFHGQKWHWHDSTALLGGRPPKIIIIRVIFVPRSAGPTVVSPSGSMKFPGLAEKSHTVSQPNPGI